MNELKPCPFCGCNVVDYDAVVRHPATDLCILSNQVYQVSEWNCRVGEDSLLRRVKEAVEEIDNETTMYKDILAVGAISAISILKKHIPELEDVNGN